MQAVIRKSPKFGNYLHYNHQAEARYGGKEQVLVGYQQVQAGIDEETGEPILGDGPPIYEDGDDLFAADWDEAWGDPPTDAELAVWEEPAPEPAPSLTDVENLANAIQARLDQRQMERTGVRPDPSGAVPRTRALAAAAMSLGGWGYPATLADEGVPEILAALYADPTSNTTEASSDTAKKRAVQYVRILKEGGDFGEQYSHGFTAYERTASPGIRTLITDDSRDWMSLACGPWETVKAMFLALLK